MENEWEPYQYQLEIAEKAKYRNCIAFLSTGSGKTFISIILIKHVANEYLEQTSLNAKENRKWIAFLAPTVPLVEQQAKVIQELTSFTVGKFFGEMSAYVWDKLTWIQELNKYQVLVCTPQMFLDLLNHGFFQLDKLALLIFDECHHATKDHPYNSVMRDFYFNKNLSSKPKIFGMTASPVKGGKVKLEAVKNYMKQLEYNLDSKIVTVSSKSLGYSYSNPEHVHVSVSVSLSPNSVKIFERKIANFQLELKNEDLFKSFKKWAGSLMHILEHLGTLAFFKTLDIIIGEINEGIKRPRSLTLESSQQLQFLNTSKKMLQTFAEEVNKEQLPVRAERLNKLFSLLSRLHDQNFRGIIFVQRRYAALILAILINEDPQLSKRYKAGHLVGHGNIDGSTESMNVVNQRKTVYQFREGTLNILVATSVAEEGLDIQACNVVIRFDPITNVKSYIQSKGRARHKNSKFVIFSEDGGNASNMLADAQLVEQYMKLICEDSDDEDFELNDNEKPRYQYTVPSTQASVTDKSSLKLLHEYCQSLPGDPFTIQKPQFNIEPSGSGSFLCKLTLPITSPVRDIPLVEESSKRRAKGNAAFMACVELHRAGELTDYLFPYTDESELDYPDSTPVDRYDILYSQSIPVQFQSLELFQKKNQTFFLYGIPLPSNCVYMGMLSPMKLIDFPPFTLYIRGISVSVAIQELAEVQFNMEVSFKSQLISQDVNKISRFSRKILQFVLRLSQEWCNTNYLFIPLQTLVDMNGGDLEIEFDWRLMNCILEDQYEQTMYGRTFSDQYGRRFFLRRVRDDLNSLSPFPSPDKASTFQEYFAKKNREIKDVYLPLYELESASSVKNAFSKESSSKSEKSYLYLPQEFCVPFSIPEKPYRTAVLLPVILRKMEQYLLAKDLANKIGMDFQPSNLIEALTAKQAGENYSYERLETLGDSVLKYLCSIYVFITNPVKHEGILSQKRAALVCNDSLCKRGISKNLPGYIFNSKFDKKQWKPPGVQKVNRRISDKTIADVSESLIGLCYLEGGFEKSLKFCKWLDFDFYFSNEDLHKFLKSYETSENIYAIQNLSLLEQKLCYSFKHKSLLVEALTHASCQRAVTHSYQRLEFLGDAALDFLVTRFLFEKYPTLSPGQLTDLRQAAVNNDSFARIACSFDFYKFINYQSVRLGSTIDKLVESSQVNALYDLDAEFELPKAIGDVFESIAGAILLDNNMDLNVLWSVYEPLMREFFEKNVTPQVVRINPLRALTELVQKHQCKKFQKKKYQPTLETKAICEYYVHEKLIGSGEANTVQNAMKRAASAAIVTINQQPVFENCNCAMQTQ